MIKFRDLRADEIDVRIQSVSMKNGVPTGVILLLYKDARVDMNILDETVGPANWQNKFYECKGNLFCSLGININYDKPDAAFPEWVWKDDCGSESNMEKEKGEASDARKRAGFAWGIGRELYTSPFIFMKAEDCNINNGKCYDKFKVYGIEVKDGRITRLAIANMTTKKTWTWPEQANKEQAKK